MNKSLRIVVADDEPDIQDYFRKILPRLRHQVVAVADNGRDLVEQCLRLRPDLVITDIKMPELDGIDAAAAICAVRPLPILLVSAYHDANLIERAEATHVMGYLVKPIRQVELEPAIAIAMRRFAQLRELQEAQTRVNQLHGLLPICSYCKKIRDDHNYWQQVEAYLAAHSDVRFSHGICPDCYEQVVKPALAEST